MPRKTLGSLVLDRDARAPLQTQLSRGLERLIQAGSLEAGEALPSSRELARDLRISRNTVIAAYDQLVGEGWLEARPRSGLYVSVLPSTRPASVVPERAAARPTRLPAGPLPFRPCQPDVRLFPLALWNRLRSRMLRAHGAALLHYQPPSNLGWPPLQRALAAYLRDSRGVPCDAGQIAITTGSQQALFLLAQLLLRPGDRVVMEDPGYHGARSAFLQAGALVEPAPVDHDGLITPVAGLEGARFIYTTPSRQFPTGASLPVARRLALIEQARHSNAWILEDDYDSEFRYSRPPLPSMHGLDATGRVIYLGSMSKVLLPALRIGYAVLPPALVDPFLQLRTVVDDHGPTIDQAALAEFIDTGAFYTHIRRCRKAYGERLDTFLTYMKESGLPLTFLHRDGGMNLAGLLPAEADDRAWSKRLVDAGFEVPPLNWYAQQPTAPGLLFGFTAFTPRAIKAAIAKASALT